MGLLFNSKFRSSSVPTIEQWAYGMQKRSMDITTAASRYAGNPIYWEGPVFNYSIKTDSVIFDKVPSQSSAVTVGKIKPGASFVAKFSVENPPYRIGLGLYWKDPSSERLLVNMINWNYPWVNWQIDGGTIVSGNGGNNGPFQWEIAYDGKGGVTIEGVNGRHSRLITPPIEETNMYFALHEGHNGGLVEVKGGIKFL